MVVADAGLVVGMAEEDLAEGLVGMAEGTVVD